MHKYTRISHVYTPIDRHSHTLTQRQICTDFISVKTILRHVFSLIVVRTHEHTYRSTDTSRHCLKMIIFTFNTNNLTPTYAIELFKIFFSILLHHVGKKNVPAWTLVIFFFRKLKNFLFFNFIFRYMTISIRYLELLNYRPLLCKYYMEQGYQLALIALFEPV